MLKLEAVHFRYGSRSALAGISLAAQPGQLISLVGRNGSGKSTLLRICAGLAKPRTGCVTWNEVALAGVSPLVRARSVGYVSQRPSLSIDLTVREMVALGGFSASPLDRAVRTSRALKELGLEAFSDRSYHDLSAGEQQRCVVARTLSQVGPHALIALDEPFSNLDPAETLRVVHALRTRAAAGALILVAMHDLALADRIGDCVWWLEQGLLVGAGAPAEILAPTRLREIFSCEFTRGAQGLTLGERVA